ncbi:potassium channel family protein [Methylomicrobium lacus]|uniref:potassium channel family protein n=1 Tax=Methylomicrobium lacus TaxID=136992 RepID=UPI0035A8A22B
MPTLTRRSKAGNYAFLLSGLLILFLLMPLLRTIPALAENALLMHIALRVGYSVLMLLGIWGLSHENNRFRFGLALALLTVTFTTINIFYDSIAIELCISAAVLLFSISSAVIAAKHVFGGTQVDRNLLFGAMCVYLLMGLIWAILYGLIFQFWPGSFNGIEGVEGKAPMDALLYFSFVTLASLGYGDITPVGPLARTLAYLEVISGQLYIAIMLAGLVGLFLHNRK